MHQCLITPDRHYEITTRPFIGCFYDPRQRLDAFRVVLRFFFGSFVSQKPFLLFFSGVYQFSQSCFIDIDNTPQCLQILFFFRFPSWVVTMILLYLYMSILFFISRWPISLHFHYFTICISKWHDRATLDWGFSFGLSWQKVFYAGELTLWRNAPLPR